VVAVGGGVPRGDLGAVGVDGVLEAGGVDSGVGLAAVQAGDPLELGCGFVEEEQLGSVLPKQHDDPQSRFAAVVVLE